MPQKTETLNELPRKPLLFADSMYASDRRDGAEFRQANLDGSYVPFYSEERSRNELRAARGEKLTPLPHLVWVRVKRTDGGNISHGDSQLTEYRMKGFVAMGLDDLESLQKALGAESLELPPTAHVDRQTGLIVKEDVALFWIGHERAISNRKKLDALNTELQSGGDDRNSAVHRDKEVESEFKGTLEQIQKIPLPD